MKQLSALGLTLLIVCVAGGSYPSATQSTGDLLLVPHVLREDFQHDSLGQFASYPPPQDIGYEPSLAPTADYGAPGGRALMRNERPIGKGQLRLGFIRQTFQTADLNSELEFAYRLNHASSGDAIEVGIAGSDGCRYLKQFRGIPGAWTKLQFSLTDLHCEGRSLRSGIGLNALYIVLDISQADPDITYRFLIDDIKLTAPRAASFLVREPRAIRIESHNATVSMSRFRSGESISPAVAAPIRMRRVTHTLQDQDGKVVSSQPLYDDGTHGDEQSGDGIWSSKPGYTFRASDDKGVWTISFSGLTDDGRGIATMVRFVYQGASNPSHPRLYFSAHERESLIARTANPRVAQLWQKILADARARRGTDPLSHGGDVFDMLDRQYLLPSLLAYFDVMNRTRLRIGNNALVAYLTKDSEARHAAKTALLAAADWKRWEPAWFTAQGQHTYYPAGQLAAEAALGYDLLYDDLSVAERALVRRALINRSIVPTYKEYVLDNRVLANTSNWIGHTVGGALIAASAIAGDVTDEESNGQFDVYLNGLLLKLEAHLAASYLPDGSYGEGISYQEFDLETTLPALTSVQRVFGIDYWERTNVKSSLAYPVYTFVPPGPASPDMGDSHPSSGRTLAPLVAQAKDALLRWFYAQFSHSSITDFIFFDDSTVLRSPEELKLPTSRIFSNKGNAIFRSGWGKDDWVFLFRAGANFNHNHADQGSFLLTAFGEPLVTESGWSHYYNDPYYATFFTQAVGHNTVLVDGNPGSQSLPDTLQFAALNSFPRITESVTSEFHDAISADLTSVYRDRVSRYFRRVVFVKPHYFVILDDIIAKDKPAGFSWLLHLPDRSRIAQSPGLALYAGEKASLAIRSLFPQAAAMKVENGRLPYVTFSTSTPKAVPPQPAILNVQATSATNVRFVTALVPARRSDDAQRMAAAMTEITGPGFVGLRAERGTERDLVVMRTGDMKEMLRLEDWSTDAVAMTLTKEGDRLKLFALQGARSSKTGDREMFTSQNPANIAVSYNQDAVLAALHVSTETKIRLFVGTAFARVLLDGREASVDYDRPTGVLSMTIPTGEHRLVVTLR